MGNDLHASNGEPLVLPPSPPRLDDDAAVTAVTAVPRPITLSLPSSFSTSGGMQPMRADIPVRLPRTVPIASPAADMSTPPSGLPLVPSVSSIPTLPALPTLPTPSTPSIPVAAPLPLIEPELVAVVQAVVEQEASRFDTDSPLHPMAHLMPPRTKPTEAQRRAHELRAANKRKARRTKVLVVVAVIALGAFAGPPLATWVADAINESGATSDQTVTDPTDASTNTGGG